jgi:hypothetical protein
MFFMDNKEHKLPHIHVEYQDSSGRHSQWWADSRKFPGRQMKLVQAWIEIHKDELMADWKLAVEGQSVFKIEALR